MPQMAEMSRPMLLRVLGVACAVAGLAVALAWNPMTCVTNTPVCPTPVPGSAPCGPPLTSCSSEYLLLRITIAVVGIGLAVVLLVMASRTDRQSEQPSLAQWRKAQEGQRANDTGRTVLRPRPAVRGPR